MMGLCSARKFSRAVCKAVSRVVADLTAASAAFLVDTSVVAKIHACPAAIAARRNVAITSHTVALAKGVSEEAGLQNLHHGDGRGWADAFSWGALLDAGKGFGGSDCGSVMRLLARPGGVCASCGSRRAANGGYADTVAPGQFVQRRALRAACGGLFLLCRSAQRLPLGLGAASAVCRPGAD